MEGLSKISKTIILVIVLLKGSLCLEDVKEMEMDSLEKDKVLTCLQVVSKRHQLDSSIINEVTSIHGDSREFVLTKLSADMLSLCYNKISDEIVRSVYNNLTYYEFEWSDEFQSLTNLDYSKYRTITDVQPTPEQNILFYKIDKAKDEFFKVTRERQEKASKSFPPVFGIDINAISSEVKVLYLVIVFAIIAVLIVFLLSRVLPKQKAGKNKKRKD